MCVCMLDKYFFLPSRKKIKSNVFFLDYKEKVVRLLNV